MFYIRHRATSCLLLIEKDRDAWVSAENWKHATVFATREQAVAAAHRFNLSHNHHQICPTQ